jgi:hypothetical protein
MSIAITIGVSGIAILIYTFYNNLDKSVPIYINLFSIPILCGLIPLTIFVGIFFIKQTKLVSRGITTKQQVSIIRSGSINYNTLLSNKDGLNNIINFLLKPQPQSLIKSD